jgi:hypothetical protein
MARSINDIQQAILNAKVSAQELDALSILTEAESGNVDSTSKVAEWRQWAWVVAVAIWALEKLFDTFKIEVEERIAATRVHTRGWYRETVLAYQDGDTLNDSGKYDVIDPSKQIIKYASVRKVIMSGHGALRVKAAKANGNDFSVLSANELAGLSAYMNLKTDAGTMIFATSTPPDSLKLSLDIYYDPQLLNSDGTDKSTGANVVIGGIKSYLKSMDFDGRLILTHLIDALQTIPGVKIPVLQYAAAKINSGVYVDLYNPQTGTRQEFYNPDAGWLVLDEALTTINYVPYDE